MNRILKAVAVAVILAFVLRVGGWILLLYFAASSLR